MNSSVYVGVGVVGVVGVGVVGVVGVAGVGVVGVGVVGVVTGGGHVGTGGHAGSGFSGSLQSQQHLQQLFTTTLITVRPFSQHVSFVTWVMIIPF